MCIKNHLAEQKRQHEALDARIRLLEMCPGRNSLEVSALKKEKLLLKENIGRLENPARATAPKSKKVSAKKSKKPTQVPTATPVAHLVPAPCAQSDFGKKAA